MAGADVILGLDDSAVSKGMNAVYADINNAEQKVKALYEQTGTGLMTHIDRGMDGLGSGLEHASAQAEKLTGGLDLGFERVLGNSSKIGPAIMVGIGAAVSIAIAGINRYAAKNEDAKRLTDSISNGVGMIGDIWAKDVLSGIDSASGGIDTFFKKAADGYQKWNNLLADYSPVAMGMRILSGNYEDPREADKALAEREMFQKRMAILGASAAKLESNRMNEGGVKGAQAKADNIMRKAREEFATMAKGMADGPEKAKLMAQYLAPFQAEGRKLIDDAKKQQADEAEEARKSAVERLTTIEQEATIQQALAAGDERRARELQNYNKYAKQLADVEASNMSEAEKDRAAAGINASYEAEQARIKAEFDTKRAKEAEKIQRESVDRLTQLDDELAYQKAILDGDKKKAEQLQIEADTRARLLQIQRSELSDADKAAAAKSIEAIKAAKLGALEKEKIKPLADVSVASGLGGSSAVLDRVFTFGGAVKAGQDVAKQQLNVLKDIRKALTDRQPVGAVFQ